MLEHRNDADLDSLACVHYLETIRSYHYCL